jgi:hypothetical protein
MEFSFYRFRQSYRNLSLVAHLTKKERVGGGGKERHYNREGVGNNIFDLKVPRHCPLVLLIGARLEFRVN